MFGNCLDSWHIEKQNIISPSINEVEYAVIGNYCAEVLWINKQLLDCNSKLACIPNKCDNNFISLTKNHVLYSCTKHIKIQHHYLRDHVENCGVTFEYVGTKNQLIDIFMKSLSIEPFN